MAIAAMVPAWDGPCSVTENEFRQRGHPRPMVSFETVGARRRETGALGLSVKRGARLTVGTVGSLEPFWGE